MEYKKAWQGIELCAADGLPERLREIKDEHELEIMREAAKLADEAYEHILGIIRPGMSATVDIETKTAENVVAVPIQSVTVRSKEGAKTIEQLTADREAKAKQTKGDGAATAVNERAQKDAERADREALQRVVFLREGDTVKMVNVETGIAAKLSHSIG